MALLFDLDGTLVDTVYEHVSAWSSALKGAGLFVPDWKIHRRIGMSGNSMIQQLLREQFNPIPKVNIRLLEKKHDAAFATASKNVRLLPDPRNC
jgi:beta-phosphoglucomutase-like phosphatase (HAD superfamily)